jgi:hypothetical protein
VSISVVMGDPRRASQPLITAAGRSRAQLSWQGKCPKNMRPGDV